MLASSIGWILIISGIGTAAGGLAGLFFPRMTLQLVFAAKVTDGVTMFFVRHWSAALCCLRTNCVCRVRSSFPPPDLDGSHHREVSDRCADFLRTREAYSGDDSRSGDGWNVGCPVRCISCRAVGLVRSATEATVATGDANRAIARVCRPRWLSHDYPF